MKLLIAMLVRRENSPWWELRSSEGNPPVERVGLHTLDVLLNLVRIKLTRVRDEHDKVQ